MYLRTPEEREEERRRQAPDRTALVEENATTETETEVDSCMDSLTSVTLEEDEEDERTETT